MTTSTEQLLRDIAEFNRYFTSVNSAAPNARISVPTSEWQALHASLSAALTPPAQPAEGGVVSLPLFSEVALKFEANHAMTPLEQFIYDNEPADPTMANAFREVLGRVLDGFSTAPPAGQEQAQQPETARDLAYAKALAESVNRNHGLLAADWQPADTMLGLLEQFDLMFSLMTKRTKPAGHATVKTFDIRDVLIETSSNSKEVTATHLPSRMFVRCNDTASLNQNRQKAIDMLRAGVRSQQQPSGG